MAHARRGHACRTARRAISLADLWMLRRNAGLCSARRTNQTLASLPLPIPVTAAELPRRRANLWRGPSHAELRWPLLAGPVGVTTTPVTRRSRAVFVVVRSL
jgi:hypothetical protein